MRKAKSKSGALQEDRKKSQEDMDDKGSVISLAYSEATSKARKGLESRWTSRSSPEFDKDSMVSSVTPSRMSTRRSLLDMDDDSKSTISSVSRSSPGSLHRSSSWKEEKRSGSRLSVARSCGLSEFGLHVDDDGDGHSVAFTEAGTSSFSPRSLSRSFSTPAQPRSSDGNPPDSSEIKMVTHRNYLDPDLEAAINEVLSFKPIKFKRSKLDESSGEEEDEKKGPGSQDGRKRGEEEGSTSSLLRSASSSALDYANRPSSTLSTSSSRSRKDKKSKLSPSDDDSSSSDDRHSRKSSRGKKSKKRSKKKQSESEDSSSSSKSSSSSSSSSAVSYRSSSSVKRAPKQPSDDDEQEPARRGPSSKKDSQKKVDSLVMKYRYRPDSD